MTANFSYCRDSMNNKRGKENSETISQGNLKIKIIIYLSNNNTVCLLFTPQMQ